ncbi:hypothetical protein BGZ57DRAFT_731011, partial [Hyaloscypha finlandica]
ASSLSARTVFLKLHPSARTFAERREVLRVMERFGEVTMFKSYKYNPRSPTPNTFLVLFASESAARDLVNASPVRYRLISNQDPSSSSPPLDYAPQPQASPPANFSTPPKQPYQLMAYPSYFSHTLHLRSPLHNPLHGPYTPIPTSSSYISSSLAQNVPSSIMTPGLLDWETDS